MLLDLLSCVASGGVTRRPGTGARLYAGDVEEREDHAFLCALAVLVALCFRSCWFEGGDGIDRRSAFTVRSESRR